MLHSLQRHCDERGRRNLPISPTGGLQEVQSDELLVFEQTPAGWKNNSNYLLLIGAVLRVRNSDILGYIFHFLSKL